MKLTYNSNSQYKEGRLDEIKNQLTKKTKEEIKGWLSPQTNKNAEIHRAGLVLRDGTFQPWFFGKKILIIFCVLHFCHYNMSI